MIFNSIICKGNGLSQCSLLCALGIYGLTSSVLAFYNNFEIKNKKKTYSNYTDRFGINGLRRRASRPVLPFPHCFFRKERTLLGPVVRHANLNLDSQDGRAEPTAQVADEAPVGPAARL